MLQLKTFFGYSEPNPSKFSRVQDYSDNRYREVNPDWANDVVIKWVSCCSLNLKESKCCMRPLIFIRGDSTILDQFGYWTRLFFWIDVDGKIYDPFNTGKMNEEIPALSDFEYAINTQERRRGLIIEDDNVLELVNDTITNLAGVVLDDKSPWFLVTHNFISKCGLRDREICFKDDGTTHRIDFHVVQIRTPVIPGGNPVYTETPAFTQEVKCEPCNYEIIAQSVECGHELINSRMGLTDVTYCCPEIIIKVNTGGLNGSGCIGGFDLLSGRAYGGRWHLRDNFYDLAKYSISTSSLKAGIIYKGTERFTREWSDTLRLYDTCGRILEEIKINLNCYEVNRDRTSRTYPGQLLG